MNEMKISREEMMRGLENRLEKDERGVYRFKEGRDTRDNGDLIPEKLQELIIEAVTKWNNGEKLFTEAGVLLVGNTKDTDVELLTEDAEVDDGDISLDLDVEDILLVDDEYYAEMATVGRLSDTLTIRVFTEREAIQPHFHLTKGSKGNWTFECCVDIKSNSYYIHTFKGDPIKSKCGKLKKDQMEELDRFLRSKMDVLPITNWKYLLIEWNKNNLDSKHQVSITMKQPDYTHISGEVLE